MSATTTTTAAPTTSLGRLHLPLLFTLLSPLHHGAGTAGNTGNTSLLRRQSMVAPDGDVTAQPMVSGNSLRHSLRSALAWHLTRTLDIPDGSLSKPVVDLLWSGGAITRTGAQVDLERGRHVEELTPWLTLMGYSAGSDMVAGSLYVNHAHLVCAENAWRCGERARALPQARKRGGSMVGEEFGTRHDVAGTAVDRLIGGGGELLAAPPATTQMIYDMHVVMPGAALDGSLEVTAAATAAQRAVLLVALDEAAPLVGGERVIRLGAKAAVGFGRARLEADLTALGDLEGARAWWEEHLTGRRDEVLGLLTELVA